MLQGPEWDAEVCVSFAAFNLALSQCPTSAKVQQEVTVRFYRVYAKRFRGDAVKSMASVGDACIE